MTVPGKGGRPRRWRSDTDRVRAYRARQRGQPEPPTVVEAAAGGDELALALEATRKLGSELDDAKRLVRSLRAQLRASAAEVEQQHTRFGWIEAENSELRSAVSRLEQELRLTVEREDQLLSRLRVLESTTRPSPPASKLSTSRAERRQREREQRRRKK
jgi:septal ring factor EnvC (AmiA/AmiB activator)